MKEIFLQYLKNQLSQNEKLRASNSIQEEDKAILDTQVESLNETISLIEALEDQVISQEMVDELKSGLETLSETVTAIKEKIQIEKKEEEPDMELENNYLASKNAIHDFAQTLRNSKTSDEFAKNWAEVLKTNGITITGDMEEAFLPEAVKGRIQSAWDTNAAWLNKLNFTGAKRFYCRYNTSDQTAENSRAKGHKVGTTKGVQSISVTAKLIDAQAIYKIQTLDNKTIWEDDSSLVDYIIGELVDQILYEVKRAILVGDGRANDSDYKINKIEAIASHDTTDSWVTVATETANGFLVDDIRSLVDNIKNDNNRDILVFMSKADLRTLARIQASAESTPVFMSKEQVAEQLGENVIIETTDLLGSDFKAIAMIPSEYYMVGESIFNPRLAQWEDFMKNQTNFRYEVYTGGGINGLKSAAVLKANA